MYYKLLTDLLPYLEAFKKDMGNDSVTEFIAWLQEAPRPNLKGTQEPSTAVSAEAALEVQIAHLLGLSHKYIKSYFRKGFRTSALQTTEDFGFLATLNHFGDLRKNELIQINTSEFTSGMEVIRRLERNGLIETFLDQEDRRARRVQLTKAGRKAFHTALPIIEEMGKIAVAPLNDSERQRLLELLHKLNHFHNPIFHQAKQHSLPEIIHDYVDP